MKIILSFLLFWSVSSAFAQPVARVDSSPWAWPYSRSGAILTPNGISVRGGDEGKYLWTVGTDGKVTGATFSKFPQKSGSDLVLDVTAKVPKASAAAAIGRFALKNLPLVNTGFALFDLARELGYTPSADANNVMKLEERFDGFICSNGTCIEFGYSSPSNGVTQWPFASAAAAAGANITALNALSTLYTHVTVSVIGLTHKVQYVNKTGPYAGQNAGQADYPLQTRTRPEVATSSFVPVPLEKFVERIETKTDWVPATSALPRTVVDAVKSGESIEFIPTTITGPATSPGEVTTTVDSTSGNTTTKTVTNTHTYTGEKVTTTTTTTEVVKNTTTNAPVSTKTETTNPTAPQEKQITCGLPDTPPCKIDETGTKDGKDAKTNEAKDAYKQIEDYVKDPTTLGKPMPNIAWSFAFPSGCSVIPLPAFAPIISSIDVCQFQPTFHDIMSLVWSLGGLFGAISLFMKNALKAD